MQNNNDMIKFRNIRADELEVRVAEKKDGYMSVLVYKDSRVDMRILDETVGNDNWIVQYKREGDTLLCGIGIYVEKHKAFIHKWAAGAETNYEKTKGEQSDALKRSGFVWGIGRALYSAPKIRIPETNAKLSVSKIEYEEDKITDLQIVDWNGNVVFDYVQGKVQPIQEIDRADILKAVCGELKEAGEDREQLKKFYYYYESKADSFERFSAKTVRNLWNKWLERANSR